MSSESQPLNEIRAAPVSPPCTTPSRPRKHKRNRSTFQRLDIEKCFSGNISGFDYQTENVENFSNISISGHHPKKHEQHTIPSTCHGVFTDSRIYPNAPVNQNRTPNANNILPIDMEKQIPQSLTITSESAAVTKLVSSVPHKKLSSILRSKLCSKNDKLPKQKEASHVSFSLPIVSQVAERPKTKPEEKTIFFYTDEEIRLFRGLWEIRNVPFSKVKANKC